MRGYLGLMAAVISLLGAPAGAWAAAAGEETMGFRLPASNGYTLQVRTEGSQTLISLERSNPTASASATGGVQPTPLRGADLSLSSTYYVSDSVGPGRIAADLGALGRIDVGFEPSGATRTVAVPGRRGGRCGAGRATRRLGVFTGTISIHGEGGFAAVEAVRARGSVGPALRRRCTGGRRAARPVYAQRARGASPGAPHGPTRVERIWTARASLLVRRVAAPRTPGLTWFTASRNANSVRFAVERIEVPRGGLTIERRIGVTGSLAAFFYRPDLTSARLRPPAPFRGEATFSSGTGMLQGDLAVDLPGLESLQLTGPDYAAQLHAIR